MGKYCSLIEIHPTGTLDGIRYRWAIPGLVRFRGAFRSALPLKRNGLRSIPS